MTANEFRETHGDPTTWTAADFETFEHLAEVEPIADPAASADRLRQLLAPAS